MQPHISHPRGTVLYHSVNLFIKILFFWFVTKKLGNYRKYILFNFRFTENMIFPSIAENQEKMIYVKRLYKNAVFHPA